MVRRVWAGFLSLLLLLGTLAAAPKPVAAAVTEQDYQSAAHQLNKYGLVQGDDRGYRFYDQLTRAEMAKLLVYSLGMQKDAARYAGRGAFTDTAGHWAEGVIGLAKTMGIMKGYPQGDFQPEADLTYAEVITALSRLVGLEASAEPWPRTYLAPAAQAGIIPADMDLALQLDDPANRGDVFVLLWRTLTVVKNQQGQNLLRRYIDQTPPSLAVDPQPKETEDPTLTVSGTAKDADQVLVNGQPVTLTYGYFQQSVSLRVGPNTIRIQALDDAGNLREETVQVTRKLGALNALALTGPSQVTVGDAVLFGLSLKDQNGNELTDRKSVQAEVTPATLGTFDPVTATFTAGTKPGTGTITVRSGSARADLGVSVVAGAVDHIAIAPPVAGLDAKGTVAFKATGADKYGNSLPISGAVKWSASGGTITDAGVFTMPDTAGLFTVTAVAGGKTGTAQVQPPNYKAAAVRLSQPTGNLKANRLSQLTLTATVVDASGAVMTDYVGSLTVSSSAPNTAGPTRTTVPVVAGTAQISVQAGTTPGTAQITAATNLSASGTVTVTADPQRLQSVRLNGVPVQGSIDTWPTAYIEAIALDTDGNPMVSPLSQTLMVHVKLPSAQNSTGGTTGGGTSAPPTAWFIQNDDDEANVALGPVDATTGDVRTRTYIRYNRGAGTLLIQGAALASMSWVQVQEGALNADQVGLPARVRIEPVVDTEAGTARTIYADVLDADGYRVTQPAPLTGLVVTLRDQNGISYTGVSAPADGVGRFHFNVTQNVAGVYTYTATLQPAGATDSRTATVVPGPAAGVTLTVSPAVIQADNASQATLHAEVQDAFGNRVTLPAYRVTFTDLSNIGAVQPFTDQTVTTGGGVAEVKVTAGTVVGVENFQVIVDNPAAPGNPWRSMVAPVTTRGLPDRLAISYGDNNGDGTPGGTRDNTVRIGVPLTVRVTVADVYGNAATYDNGRRITLTARNTVSGAETPVGTATTAAGRATFSVSLPAAGTYALKAESAGLMKGLTAGYGGALADAVFNPGSTLGLALDADIRTLNVGGGGNYALITPRLTDDNGNPTTNQTGHPIAVTLSFPSDANGFNIGYFTVDNAPASAKTTQTTVYIAVGSGSASPVRFYSGTAAGTRTIAASTPDGSGASTTVTCTTLGAPAGIVIQEIQPAPANAWTYADSATDGQTVIATVVDSAGNRLSGFADYVSIAAQDADVRVVARNTSAPGTFESLDTVPGNGAGNYTGMAYAVADRGQVVFRVRANTPGTKLYRVALGTDAATGQFPATKTGRFDIGVAGLQFIFTKSRIKVAGDQTQLTVQAVDMFGNLLTGASGSLRVTTDSPLLGPSTQGATVASGIATVTLQSIGTVNGLDTQVNVTVSGTVSNTQVQGTAPVFLDGKLPQLTGVTLASPGNPTGVMAVGDQITLTYDESLNWQSLIPGLYPGQTVTAGLGNLSISAATQTISFDRLPGVGTIQLQYAAVSGDATYQVAAVALDGTGTQLTITLGAQVGGSTGPTVNLPAAPQAIVTNDPANPPKDLGGNPAVSPSAVPLTGGF